MLLDEIKRTLKQPGIVGLRVSDCNAYLIIEFQIDFKSEVRKYLKENISKDIILDARWDEKTKSTITEYYVRIWSEDEERGDF
jgi:hypothetical protein